MKTQKGILNDIANLQAAQEALKNGITVQNSPAMRTAMGIAMEDVFVNKEERAFVSEGEAEAKRYGSMQAPKRTSAKKSDKKIVSVENNFKDVKVESGKVNKDKVTCSISPVAISKAKNTVVNVGGVRNFSSKFVKGVYAYKTGMSASKLLFKTVDELNTWYVLNSLFVCKRAEEVDELTDLYSRFISKFGFKVAFDTYFDFNADNAVAVLGQQSTSDSALIELYTNMVDAVKGELMMRTGMDYLHDDSYKQMTNKDIFASENFKSLDLSNRIEIDVEPIDSSAEKFNFIFRDKGTGVESTEFESTLLSTLAGNKKNIKFMQGRFNIGSAGILQYSTMKFYLSRRSDVMGDSTGNYGFTIVRKGDLNDIQNDNGYWEYMYLEDKDGNRFIPFISNKVKLEYIYGALGSTFDYGTAIKCFEVSKPYGVNNSNARDYSYNFSTRMVDPLIQGRLCHVNEKAIRSLYGRLAVMDDLYFSNSEKLEAHEIYNITLRDYKDGKVNYGNVNFKLVFNALAYGEENYSEYYVNGFPLTFSLGGQAQGRFNPSWLESRARIQGLSRILPYCMFDVIMDDVPQSLLNSFFGSDRETVRDTDFSKAVIRAVIETIRESITIKDMISRYTSVVTVKNQNLTEKMENSLNKSKFHKDSIETVSRYHAGDFTSSGTNASDNTSSSDNRGRKPGTVVSPTQDAYISDKTKKVIKITPGMKYKTVEFVPTNISDDDFKKNGYTYSISCGKYGFGLGTYTRYMDSNPRLTSTQNLPTYAPENYSPLGITYSQSVNKYLTINGTSVHRAVIHSIIHPDYSQFGPNDLYFERCVIKDGNGRTVYDGTAVYALEDSTTVKRKSKRGNHGGKVGEGGIPTPNVVLINKKGNEGTGTLSYKNATPLVKPFVGRVLKNNEWDEYMGSIVMDSTTLTDIYLNLDSTYFKTYVTNHKKKSVEDLILNIVNICFTSYLSNFETVVMDMKKRVESSGGKEELSAEDIDKLKNHMKSVENTVKNMMLF